MPTTRKISVVVKSKKDAEAIQVALADPECYALMVIIGTMLPLSARHRAATLNYVADMMDIEGVSVPIPEVRVR